MTEFQAVFGSVGVTHEVAWSPTLGQDSLRNGDMHDIQGGLEN